jgi:hypothetical protein
VVSPYWAFGCGPSVSARASGRHIFGGEPQQDGGLARSLKSLPPSLTLAMGPVPFTEADWGIGMTNNSQHSEITDATMVRMEWAGGVENPLPCTWAAWKAANGKDLGDDDFTEIAAAIRDPSCKCIMGGGASPIAYISRADTDSALQQSPSVGYNPSQTEPGIALLKAVRTADF